MAFLVAHGAKMSLGRWWICKDAARSNQRMKYQIFASFFPQETYLSNNGKLAKRFSSTSFIPEATDSLIKLANFADEQSDKSVRQTDVVCEADGMEGFSQIPNASLGPGPQDSRQDPQGCGASGWNRGTNLRKWDAITRSCRLSASTNRCVGTTARRARRLAIDSPLTIDYGVEINRRCFLERVRERQEVVGQENTSAKRKAEVVLSHDWNSCPANWKGSILDLCSVFRHQAEQDDEQVT